MTAPVTSPHAAAGGPAPEPPLRHTVRLGTWGPVAVYAHWSALLTFVLFADLLAASALPVAEPGRGSLAYWLTGSVTALVFLLTVLGHELAHAVVARHYRMPVRRITLWALGGLTELGGEPATPRAAALIALAGPLTGLGIGAVSAVLAWTVGGAGLPGAALAWLAAVSIVLGVFNLLPGAPLDGGQLLQAVLWASSHDRARARRGAAAAGRVLGIVFIALGVFELAAGAAGGIWLALIGWFMTSAAAGDAGAAQLDRLQGLRAADVMTPARVVVPDWWTVLQVLGELTPDKLVQPVFPLVDFAGAVSGAVTLVDLERVPADRRSETRVRELLRGRRPPLVVADDATLGDVVLPMRLHGGVVVVTATENRPVGVITAVELVRAAKLAELGWTAGPRPDA